MSEQDKLGALSARHQAAPGRAPANQGAAATPTHATPATGGHTTGAMAIVNELSTPLTGAPTRGETIMFLEPARPRPSLVETADYRPGAGIAFVFLAAPGLSALVVAALAPVIGAPLWLALTLLLLVPLSLAGWWALGGVRLTRESIAFGRPLRPWNTVALDSVTRLESRGWRLTLVTAARRRYTFIPMLLARGAQLRRRLLLSLPVSALDEATRAEAQRMLEGELFVSGDKVDALTLRTSRWFSWTLAALTFACIAAAAALAIWTPALTWLALVVGGVALLPLLLCLWVTQELFINDRGLIARFKLLGITRSVAWEDVRTIRRAPGEVALTLRSKHRLTCAGPGLLAAPAARQMREAVTRHAVDRGTPMTPLARR